MAAVYLGEPLLEEPQYERSKPVLVQKIEWLASELAVEGWLLKKKMHAIPTFHFILV